MAPPSSGAWASASSGRGPPAWVLLHREARVADLDPAGTGAEADVVLHLVPPPGVSSASVDRALHADDSPDPDDACDDDTPPCRIEGADASGRLLFALPWPRAPGESHLLVCRPVASSDHYTAKGKAVSLPAFPEQAFGLALSAAAPTCIIADPDARGGDGFFVAQVRAKPSSASASASLVVAFFSSDTNSWAVAEVPDEDDFTATSVVSHDRVVHADAARLVFVDMRRRALLLFNPRRLRIELPDGGGGEEIDQGQATVGSSEGRLVYILFEEMPEGILVRFWSLSQDEGRWTWTSHFSPEEVFGCDARVWPARGRPALGPIDPNTLTCVVLGIRGAGAGMPAFSLEVTPDEMWLRRVSCDAVDSLVCPLQAPKSTWMETMNSAAHEGKHVAMLAMGAVQKARKYIDFLPGAVHLVGTTLSLPHMAVAMTTVKAVKTVNDSVTISEEFPRWVWKNRPGRLRDLCRVVGSKEEAEEALRQWVTLGRPRYMVVDPAPEGLTQEDWDAIRDWFVERGAGTLVQPFDDDYVVVGRPPR